MKFVPSAVGLTLQIMSQLVTGPSDRNQNTTTEGMTQTVHAFKIKMLLSHSLEPVPTKLTTIPALKCQVMESGFGRGRRIT